MSKLNFDGENKLFSEDDILRVSTLDDNYTFIKRYNRQGEILRNGEEWLESSELADSAIMVSIAYDLRQALNFIKDLSIMENPNHQWIKHAANLALEGEYCSALYDDLGNIM